MLPALPVCSSSMRAISGSVGATIQAIDSVVASARAQPSPAPPTVSAPNILPALSPKTPPLASSSRAAYLSEPSTPSSKTAFVAVRPPGHHCGEDNPQGFCFVNNVLVGAGHGAYLLLPLAPSNCELKPPEMILAYLEHGIDRIVVLDIGKPCPSPCLPSPPGSPVCDD